MPHIPYVKNTILSALYLVAVSALEVRAACPVDPTSSQVQYGAASGQLGFPISGAQECDTEPVSVTASAGPLGGTYWQGTAFGELGTARSTYTFTFSSGWWGWTPACMGLFFIPDISISGAGDTVDLRVNVTFGGMASNPADAVQSVAWLVRLRTPDGNQLASRRRRPDKHHFLPGTRRPSTLFVE
jgi:hypothetical protein